MTDAASARVTTAAVVLAAGAGSRFVGSVPKLLADLRGRPLVVHAVAAAVESGIGPIVVVTGAIDVRPALDDAGLLDRVTLVPNPIWAEGQATSLAAGIAAATGETGETGVRRTEAHVDAVVVGLADQPGIPPESWRLVAAAGDGEHPIAVATYGGRRRNPVRLARAIWADLPTTGDEGARSLMASRPELVIEVGCPGQPGDVDTVEDLDRWS